MRISEELASYLTITKEMRILDLACGMGLSALFLTQQYGATVFAADLWISPTENYERFKSVGIADRAIPVSVDATKGLPFAHGYFDILFTVDGYHYFGDTEEMLPSLIPFVKKGGYIAIAIPGLHYEFGENVPDEMKPWWNEPEIARTIRGLDWWKDLWRKTSGIEIVDIREMACHKQAWDEWLTGYIPEAAEDIPMMEAENGKYFNTIQLIARVI
ncbi:MAG: methyltransferase domain-containing protein [Oscillospiraceae bacterium]|nr:methyltransferase domain-containing protein [Oscillospiraceae bacterium]